MHKMLESTNVTFASRALAAIALAGATLGLAGPASAQTNTNPVVTADLWGASGTGSFTGVVDSDAGELCYLLNAASVADRATSASIKAVDAGGNAGSAVVTLEVPSDGASGECATIGADVAAALVANPGGYAVEVDAAGDPTARIHGLLRG